MSRIRQQQHPWLADHVVFFSYRWLSWGVACVAVWWQGRLPQYGWLLLLTFLVTILATVLAQPYVRAAQRNPLCMIFDIILAALLLATTGGWYGPFALHAASSLVLPGLLFSWRGGVMAGLAFVTLDLAAGWAIMGSSPASLVERGRGDVLMLSMTISPIAGCGFPVVVGLIRRGVAQRLQRRARRLPDAGPRVDHGPHVDPVNRFTLGLHDAEQERGRSAAEASLALRTPTVRAVEQGIEDLRRVVFAPFPTVDIELPAALDLLAARFGQHTGTTTRVTLLGRVRVMHRAHRAVLIRLAQEALLNVQQHAHAALIELTLRYDVHSVALLIQDDGVGLLDGTYERPGLHALRAMHYRLAELGGRLDVFETEGGGVTVRATMPLE